MEELLNIWNADDELNEDELINYVKGESSKEEEHSVEKQMADSLFVDDAVEGLQQFSSTDKLNSYVQQINKNLHKQLRKRMFKNRKAVAGSLWQIIAVVIIILLCILGYVVIEMIRK